MLKTIKNGLVKTILVSLVAICFMNSNNAKAYTIYNDCGGNGYNDNICIEFNPSEYYTLNNNVNMIMPNRQFNYFGDNNYKTNYAYYEYKSNQQNSFMFWYNGNLVSVLDGNYKDNVKAYSIDKVCMYNGTDNDGIFNKCIRNVIGHRCTDQEYSNSYNVNFSDFKSAVNGYSPSKFVVLSYNWSYNGFEGPVLCGTYGNITYCINKFGYDYTNNFCTGAYTLYDSGSVVPGTAFEFYSQYFQNSPLSAGSTNYPTITGAETQPNGTTTYNCPTIQQVLNTYPSEYKPSNCKTSTRVYINGQATATGSKTIFDLYESYQFFHQDRSSYKAYCKNTGYTGACASMFDSKPFEYNLISKLDTDKIGDVRLWEYCNLELNYDKNATTCTTSGSIVTPPSSGTTTTGTINEGITITNEGIIQEIINGDYTPILPGGNYNTGDNGTETGSTADSVWDLILKAVGDDEGTGENNTDTRTSNGWDILDDLNQVYTKITGIFQGRSGKQGIIPGVVGIILLVIVLFKIFKK